MPELITFLVLLALGYFFGRAAEARHYKTIREREAVLNAIPAMATKLLDPTLHPRHSQLVMGSVVISVDYFKMFVAGLRNLVGGRVSTYETLVDRARREAILRMKEQAQQLGANLIFNTKLETSRISQGQRSALGSIEVLAYGTALVN